MNRMLRCVSFAFALALLSPVSHANNITVGNLSLTDVTTAVRTLNAQFDVTWDNSWFLNPANPPGNYDAAWLVIKYHTGDGLWRTATLDTNAANHVVPVNYGVTIARNGTNGVGALLHRTVVGSGTATANGVKLKWLYGADGVSNSSLITAEIHAIEMVFIPSNAFKVGDGTAASYFKTAGTTTPFTINSATITAGTNAGLLKVGGTSTGSYTIASTFPNGLNDFYIMKYEASQGQFVDFLNKTEAVGTQPTANSVNGVRQVVTDETPDFVAQTPDRAYLNSDPLDYLDFVCLRPMTEFEYEKACRGTANPVPGEYAWGTAVAATKSYALSNDGTPTEGVASNYNETAGNCWYEETQPATNNFFQGPCRVGMFAKSSYNGTTSARIQSGATYYGVMDMTGNGMERMVKVPISPTDSSTNFTGLHGDGIVGTTTAGWSVSDLVNRGGDCSYYFSSFGHTGTIYQVSVQATFTSRSAVRGVRSLP